VRSLNFKFVFSLVVVSCAPLLSVPAQSSVEQWGICELSFKGPTNVNPFLDTPFSAQFTFDYADSAATDVTGFYDGDGTYRVRFMPPIEGAWHYITRSSIPELDRKSGQFTVTKPTAKNHGPVHVTNTFHFAYADGKPFKQLGTTCYAWIHQDPSLEEQTLKTFVSSPFNKIRFCIFPKRYDWNTNEPLLYPFEGTPPRDWDFSRFNPKFFHHLEKRIADLRDLGIEADLMRGAQDDRYLRYVISRLAAYRNVWWSLANEYDFMKEKREEDFERFGQIVSTSDPYHHLLSIHNGKQLFNHTRPWISHASIQNGSAVEDPARAVLYRDAYRKPIVFDEVKYEGNIPKRWGNISAEELVFRFWQGTIAGTYVGHGETYLHPSDILWWSKGGVLRGQSPPRLAFLRRVLEESPPEGIEPIDKWQNSEYGGQPGKYYLVYLGKAQPTFWEFKLPKPPQGKNALEDGMKFKAEVLDTWNMTVTPVPGIFTLSKKTDYFFGDRDDRKIELPARPYIAIRIKRIEQ
jgi:Domain of unknown function (DUF5605)/Domain of unknown function (DUF5060)/Protein of unknown function (DUF4038)